MVKIGGSLITDKSTAATLLQERLDQVAGGILSLWRALGPGNLVLVHGAGSFGHHEAKLYGLRRGGVVGGSPSATAVGATLTRAAVRDLNGHVCRALAAAGLPAVAISPADAGAETTAHGSSLTPAGESALSKAVARSLSLGFLPVLHGDVVIDTSSAATSAPQPLSVLSGDVIVSALARTLASSAAVTMSDVPGLLTAPPGEPGSALVRAVVLASAPAARPGTATLVAAVVSETRLPGGTTGLVVRHGAEIGDPGAGGSMRLGGVDGGAGDKDFASAAAAPDVTGGMHGKVFELCGLVLSLGEGSACLVGMAGGGAALAAALAPGCSDASAAGTGEESEALRGVLCGLGVGTNAAARAAGFPGTAVVLGLRVREPFGVAASADG